MSAPFLDLAAATRELEKEMGEAITRVVRSGWYIGGDELAAFEAEWAACCEAAHCVGVSNGLDALQLALRALDVGPGDEVLLPSNTFIAGPLAVSNVGARPVFVEPDPATFNLDPARVAAAITPRTRVLMPTHLYGQPADLDLLAALAEQHGLHLVEDAAQAHGARYKGRRIGAHGRLVAWSFYPGKNLGALGDAGAVTTDDPALAAKVRQLGNYGSTRRYHHDVTGVNARLDPLQAAVLRVKLTHLDAWNERRRKVAAMYRSRLAASLVVLPAVPDWAEPVWHLFVVRTPERDRLAAHLAAAGVSTLIHYPVPPHRQPAYADLGLAEGSLPVAERLAGEVLSLPIGPHLTQEEAERVCAAVLSF